VRNIWLGTASNKMCWNPREFISIGRDNGILYAGARVQFLNIPLIYLMGGFSTRLSDQRKKNVLDIYIIKKIKDKMIN
jgi:hypothetical protein